MIDLENTTFCVIDTETTGLDARRDRICDIAFVITTMKDVVYSVDTLVDPGIPIPARVSAIHHIFDHHVVGAPKEFPYGIRLPPRDCYVAHNAAFDSAFLPQLDRKPWLCTRRLAKRVLPKLPGYGNQALRSALKLKPELPPGAQPHRALPDALVTAALLRYLLARLPDEAPHTLEGLIVWSAEPMLLATCRFGSKHRGKPWSEVPLDYLRWIERECSDLNADTRHTIEHYLELSKRK